MMVGKWRRPNSRSTQEEDCIPPETREQIGSIALLKKTPEGFLIVPGQPRDFFEEFRRAITSESSRTGKPESWSPSKMKAM